MALSSLRGEREFRKVRAHGVAVRAPLFTLRVAEYRPRHGEAWRPRAIIGIVVPKKVLKRAVDRNRARRRVREALRTLPGGLPPCRAILMPTPATLSVPFTELQDALTRALTRSPGRKGKRTDGNAGKPGAVSGPVTDSPSPAPPLPGPSVDRPREDRPGEDPA